VLAAAKLERARVQKKEAIKSFNGKKTIVSPLAPLKENQTKPCKKEYVCYDNDCTCGACPKTTQIHLLEFLKLK
jgi:hypothetical protein